MSSVEHVIPARGGLAVELEGGDRLTVVDLEGLQVGDLIAVVRGVPGEFLSVAHTRGKLGRLSVREPDSLWTNLRRPILQVVQDTVGCHDLLWPACDPERYQQDFGISGHDNCRENLHRAMAGALAYTAVPDPVNLFMHTEIGPAGELQIAAPLSRPGDQITLVCLLPCTVAVSACPQDQNPCNGYQPSPLLIRIDR